VNIFSLLDIILHLCQEQQGGSDSSLPRETFAAAIPQESCIHGIFPGAQDKSSRSEISMQQIS
jgi:hypothetical protein